PFKGAGIGDAPFSGVGQASVVHFDGLLFVGQGDEKQKQQGNAAADGNEAAEIQQDGLDCGVGKGRAEIYQRNADQNNDDRADKLPDARATSEFKTARKVGHAILSYASSSCRTLATTSSSGALVSIS